MAMTLAQAQGVMRQLHGQYTTEKAAIAYLDEMLTAITSSTAQIEAIERTTKDAEQACLDTQAKLDGMTTLYETKVREMDALYATVKAEMSKKIDETKATYIRAQQDATAYQAQLAQEELAYQVRIATAKDTLTALHAQKLALDEQVFALQDKVRAIRQSMAEVPA